MTRPKVKTVNVVTMVKGQQFAERLFDGSDAGDACDETDILIWPGDHGDDDPADDATESFHGLTKDICRRVYEATKDQIAEAFVRIANAAIDEERRRENEQLSPPRIETVRVVTVEHADTLIDVINERLIDTGTFTEGFSEAAIMTWPDDASESPTETEAQKHYNALADEIRDRLFAETRPLIAEAFVRIASDVTTRERRRR
jgi:hypothetical protein